MANTDGKRSLVGLSKSDLAEWERFTKQIDPLKDKKDAMDDTFEALLEQGPEPEEFEQPQNVLEQRPRPLRRIQTQLAEIEYKFLKKLKNRDIRIEGRLDLHGCTQERARFQLLQFLRTEQSQRHKFVLVITGKGESQRNQFGMSEIGILRQQLPKWLIDVDFQSLVAASSLAYRRDGGEGARYVQIRRLR